MVLHLCFFPIWRGTLCSITFERRNIQCWWIVYWWTGRYWVHPMNHSLLAQTTKVLWRSEDDRFFPPDPYPRIGSDPIFRGLVQLLYVQVMTKSGWILLFGQFLVEENENHPSEHKYVRSTMRCIPVWCQILQFLPIFWRGWLSEPQCLNGLISL